MYADGRHPAHKYFYGPGEKGLLFKVSCVREAFRSTRWLICW